MKLAAPFVLLFLYSANAHADCSFIAKDNGRLAKKLNSLQAAVLDFETTLGTMETVCQREQAGIASTGAAQATAESCVALKENAIMNRKLTSSSESCTDQSAKLRTEIDTLTAKKVNPFADGMTKTSALQESIAGAFPKCASEFEASSAMKDRSLEVLQRARDSIAKAESDIKNFTNLGNHTRGFSVVSQAVVDRCGFPAAVNLTAPPPLGHLAGREVPVGTSAPDASTVTGRIDSPQLTDTGATKRISAPAADLVAPAVSSNPALRPEREVTKAPLPAAMLGQLDPFGAAQEHEAGALAMAAKPPPSSGSVLFEEPRDSLSSPEMRIERAPGFSASFAAGDSQAALGAAENQGRAPASVRAGAGAGVDESAATIDDANSLFTIVRRCYHRSRLFLEPRAQP